jgi:hypothetical protein
VAGKTVLRCRIGSRLNENFAKGDLPNLLERQAGQEAVKAATKKVNAASHSKTCGWPQFSRDGCWRLQ